MKFCSLVFFAVGNSVCRWRWRREEGSEEGDAAWPVSEEVGGLWPVVLGSGGAIGDDRVLRRVRMLHPAAMVARHLGVHQGPHHACPTGSHTFAGHFLLCIRPIRRMQ